MVKKGGAGKNGRIWTVRPRWRITRAERIAMGPGKADLLEAIGRTRAISRAALELGMSYRRAWMLVAEMNASFSGRLVETSRWRGEGATLTPVGLRVLRLYRSLETRSLRAVRGPIHELKGLLAAPMTRRPRKH